MSVNRVIISGNLTRGIEVKSVSTASGSALVGEFSVAVNEYYGGRDGGERRERTAFVDCTMWGDRASKLQPYLAKGTRIAVDGRLAQSRWTAQDGTNRSKLYVLVDRIEFMQTRRDGAAPASGQPQVPAYPAQMNDVDAQFAAIPTTLPAIDANSAVYDEDIPF